MNNDVWISVHALERTNYHDVSYCVLEYNVSAGAVEGLEHRRDRRFALDM
jgi:hypothetical protein